MTRALDQASAAGVRWVFGAIVLLTPLLVLRPAAQDPGVPRSVIQKHDQIRIALETDLNLSRVVTREEALPRILTIVRRDARAAASWQLEATALTEMSDAQTTELVLRRAQHVLVCTASLWSRVLASELDSQPQLIRRFLSDMAPAGASGAYSVGPDCVTLVDRSGEPVQLRRSQEVSEVLVFERQFAESVASRVNVQGLTQGAMYKSNAAYFTKEFAPSLAEDRGFAEALRRLDLIGANTQTFRFSMNNLSLYLSYDVGGEARLLFLAPFSW